MAKYKVGIVVSEFNFDITSMMLERAISHAEFLDVEVSKIIKVPGVFDMPIAIKKLVSDENIDGVVTLGCVIEGETEHDQIVIQQTSRKITDLSVESGKPVTLGISGPGMTRLQAEDRIEKARDAMESCVKLLKRLH